jgi:limonene-1,2-epoxide hydrolase
MGDIAVGDDDYQLTLDEGTVRAHLQGLHTHDFDKAHRAYRRDAVLIQPQLGSTITGRDNIKAARSARTDRELVKIDVVIGQGDLWVAECVFSEGGKQVIVVSVLEFCEGQIAREREYTGPVGAASG